MSKRQERRNASLKRRPQTREPYDIVLIVCEGEKTEPHYFIALKKELRLSHANIRICGKECGSSPMSVVTYALQEGKAGDYDRVFCVFDKDRHATYQAALDKIKSSRLPRGAMIEAIPSVPCFEFWLLLHFDDSARPYASVGNKSACERVVNDLKKYVPGYEKGAFDIFDLTFPAVDVAIKRAELLEERQETSGTDNPSTRIHRLVTYLRNIKKND